MLLTGTNVSWKITRLVWEKEKHAIISSMSWCKLDTDVHKIFSCKVSFKCRSNVFQKMFVIVYRELSTFLWSTITATEVVLTQLLSYNVVSKHKNKNENTKYSSMFISFKSHLYSKQGSSIFLLFGSWSLALYLLNWVKSKYFQ